jgi:phosphate transport system permease protein
VTRPRGRTRLVESIAHGALALATLVVLAPFVGIVGILIIKGAGLISWPFLTEAPRDGLRAGGLMPAAVGTLLLMVGTALLSLPVGVAAAIYLREYASNTRPTRVLRLAILNLAGVPSIVHGLFGLAVFVCIFRLGGSLLASCLTLALLVLPTVIAASEEALGAVPDSLREASEGLGATRHQTIARVVLPNALPGILTGAILSMGRAAGATAPILFTGVAASAGLPGSPLDRYAALSHHVYVVSTQVAEMPPARPYATAMVLILVVLATSATAIVLRARSRGRSLA